LFGILATRRARDDERPDWTSRAMHAIPAALGLWMLLAAGPRLPGEYFVEGARGKFAIGKIMPALEDAGRALALGARNPELQFQLGEVHRMLSQGILPAEMKRGAMEDAHEAYAKAREIFPQDVNLILREAWALGRLDRFDEAERLLAQAKELDPHSHAPWTYAALHWKYRNRPAEALADYGKATQLGGGLVHALASELFEKLDPVELEKLAKGDPAPGAK
jgi:tetratricopeptide (TPR) repeat protein